VTVRIRQVWGDIEVTLTNDLDKPARAIINLHDKQTNIVDTVATTRLIAVGETVKVTIPKKRLSEGLFAPSPVLPGHSVWVRPAEWRDVTLTVSYKAEDSNQIVYMRFSIIGLLGQLLGSGIIRPRILKAVH